MCPLHNQHPLLRKLSPQNLVPYGISLNVPRLAHLDLL
nr:MAG TPA: hypothetical protein [Caudoviricetes sp.]